LFDDVYEVLSSSNILSDSFNSSGFFKVKLDIVLNGGIKTNHYISIMCDGNYDNIISAAIGNDAGDSEYEFFYKGDSNILFDYTKNVMYITFENLKYNTLQLTIDNDKYGLINTPYKL
jgi:hypothetical protein